jgi:hypothetical protein
MAVVALTYIQKLQEGTTRRWITVGLVRTYVSEERVASIFKVERISARRAALAGTVTYTFKVEGISELRAALAVFTAKAVPSSLILSTLKMEAIRSSETLVLRRPTQHHILEDGILQSPP